MCRIHRMQLAGLQDRRYLIRPFWKQPQAKTPVTYTTQYTQHPSKIAPIIIGHHHRNIMVNYPQDRHEKIG